MMRKYLKLLWYIIVVWSMIIFVIICKRSAGRNNFYNSHSVIPNISDPNDFLIDKVGCIIPNYIKNWTYYNNTWKSETKTCNNKIISIKPLDNDQIRFYIDEKGMTKYLRRNSNFKCYYQFGKPVVLGEKQVYNNFMPLKNNMTVKQLGEVIRVFCEMNPGKKNAEFIYDDVIVIMKPILKTANHTSSRKAWNVLLLGIGYMSRARINKAMPQTVNFLRKSKWLDYKGYHTVGHTTLPNLISLLTGRNMSTLNEMCNTPIKNCDNISIWQQYKNAGYVTAFGDDHFQLSNVFTKHGLHISPSDHYLQSSISNQGILSDNNLCTKKSSTQLLDYARQFVNLYTNRKFFGMFWISSYINSIEINPFKIDEDVVEFLIYITKLGILKNTIIILLSDHGITNGELRIPVESYYEERMPILFVKVPDEFKKLFREEANHASFNQNFLLTPYDLYITLTNIMSLSGYFTEATNAVSCFQCSGLFTKYTSFRACKDVGIDEKWCGCHDMISIEDYDERSIISLEMAVSYIKNKANEVKTIPCSACDELQLQSIIRKHFYWYNNKFYYVILFKMIPGELIYEATILDDNNKLNILPPILNLSYHNKGNCVINPDDQKYCLCNFTKCNKITYEY